MLCSISVLNAEPRLAYVFSGGGARAYAHIGVLKVLEQNGIQPDLITGTSMGAVVGALYAMGYNASDVERLLLDFSHKQMLDDSFHRKELYIGQKRWAPYGPLNLEVGPNYEPRIPSSIWVGNNLNLELAKMLAPSGGIIDFDQLPIPFGCVATDLISGEAVFFREGNLMQAVRSSLSIPSLIQPFELDGRVFIDGGVSQNFPIAEAWEMGAEYIIGIKTNSALRKRKDLNNFVHVLDQTINIGMTRNVELGLGECDLLLEPDLEGFGTLDYDLASQIIAVGEEYALSHLEAILAFKKALALENKTKEVNQLTEPGKRELKGIGTLGNQHLSLAKIKDYLGLEIGKKYSIEQIIDACRNAWNSQLFQVIYPVIDNEDGAWVVTLHIKEQARRQLGIQLSYNSEDGVKAGALFKMNNILLKNSTLQAAVTLGGISEYNLDYVKNFGQLWGSYFRVFQFFTEKRKYYYDDDFRKTASVKAKELGINFGVGVFASKYLAAEGFLYSFRTTLSRDVSSVAEIDSLYLISGMGLKMYHESLDDYYFPMSGFKSRLKFNFSRSIQLSDYVYSKVLSQNVLYIPLNHWFSLKSGFETGSWFGGHEINADPFYEGGSTGFMGYQKYELSAPVYKVVEAGLTANAGKGFFSWLGVQGLNIDKVDYWGAKQKFIWCGYAGLGYKSPLGPLKFTIAAREKGHINYYLNLGFDLDVFHFSRH